MGAHRPIEIRITVRRIRLVKGTALVYGESLKPLAETQVWQYEATKYPGLEKPRNWTDLPQNVQVTLNEAANAGTLTCIINLWGKSHEVDFEACVIVPVGEPQGRRVRCVNQKTGCTLYSNDPYDHQCHVALSHVTRKHFDTDAGYHHWMRLSYTCRREHDDPTSPMQGEDEADAVDRAVAAKLCIRAVKIFHRNEYGGRRSTWVQMGNSRYYRCWPWRLGAYTSARQYRFKSLQSFARRRIEGCRSRAQRE